MLRRRSAFTPLILLFLLFNLSARTGTLSGKVTNAEGAPVLGAINQNATEEGPQGAVEPGAEPKLLKTKKIKIYETSVA